MKNKNALIASLFIGFVTTNTFAADAAPRLLRKAEPIQLEGGEWHHELHVDDTLIPCTRAKGSPFACVAYSIEVFDTSLQWLDCMLNVWVPGYCTPQPKIDTSALTIDCKMNLDRAPLRSVEYPPESRRAGESGLVYVHSHEPRFRGNVRCAKHVSAEQTPMFMRTEERQVVTADSNYTPY